MTKKRTKLYRFLEILPGLLTWSTIIGAIVLSRFAPTWVAIYIILFDLYWVLKAINHAIHLIDSFRTLRAHSVIDWHARLERLNDLTLYKQYLSQRSLLESKKLLRREAKRELQRLECIDFTGRNLDWQQVIHLVILPTYKESLEVLDNSVRSLVDADYPTNRIFFVLATEERDLEAARENGDRLKERYGHLFWRFEAVMHPDNIPGEVKAKGANATHAARVAEQVLAESGIRKEDVVVSAFDSDTVVARNYFSYLTYTFLTTEKPFRTAYQPMPVYNNNIWDAPAIARVTAVANSFWTMVEASRPDRLVTFSSHAHSLKALSEVGFWPVDAISDDSQIFWRCWLYYHSDYRAVPLFTNVSLDAMFDETYTSTLIGQYKQKRRWAYGIENFPYLVTGAIKDRLIPLWKKFLYIERMLEGFYFWATASIMIAVLGWLPLFLGSHRFEDQVLAVNLPVLTRIIMQVATFFLIFSVYFNMVMLPKRPPQYSRWRSVNMVLQWIFVPIVSSVFGSFPAIDAQTRLMFGKYMGFWVTPKARRAEIADAASVFQEEKNEVMKNKSNSQR